MTEGLEGKTCEKWQTAWGQSFKPKEAEGKPNCLAEAERMVQAEEECTLAAEEEGKTQLLRRQLTAMRV